MIVFVPTPPEREKWPHGLEFGVSTTMSYPASVPRYVDKVFVDISLRRARAGASLHEYIKFVSKVRAKAPWAELWIVFPDVYCSAAETRRNYEKFKRLAAAVPPLKRHVYVAQEFWKVLDFPGDADVVAVPARRQCDVNCSKKPDICTARIIEFIRSIRGRQIHLLGPPVRVLRAVQHLITSFDTTAYKFANGRDLKEMLGGGWRMARHKENTAEIFLFRWLERAGLLDFENRKLTDERP
jgi:hypothetical protein